MNGGEGERPLALPLGSRVASDRLTKFIVKFNPFCIEFRLLQECVEVQQVHLRKAFHDIWMAAILG